MKYFPSENITYRTSLSTEEVYQRLSENTEPQKLMRFKGFGANKNHKTYEGRVTKNNFHISRIIGYRNSFLPQIAGEIRSSGSGSVVDVKMNLHVLVWIFIAVWVLVVLSFGIGFFVSGTGAEGQEWVALIPVGMSLFVYLMALGGFKFESRKTIQNLGELLEATAGENVKEW
ncbi:MAG: hypothetical protein R3C61_10305 [Bacteroidia bacterium]